jgi:CubicO group peptidase (beta-lactamase class C family)
VRQYLPELPKHFTPMTTEQLLAMSSGLGNISESFQPSSQESNINLWQDYSSADLLKVNGGMPLEIESGSKYLYSNQGYVLVGLLIERLTGSPYYEFLKAHLFKPLGMKTAREASRSDLVPHRTNGFF